MLPHRPARVQAQAPSGRDVLSVATHYGPSVDDGYREAGRYIDRILKGARPTDLPAIQPTRYYLAVNLKTATSLGLTMPPSLLLRTDELIQ
jgi:putative tryptophan/tyrosine transport system substrate-binding protein